MTTHLLDPGRRATKPRHYQTMCGEVIHVSRISTSIDVCSCQECKTEDRYRFGTAQYTMRLKRRRKMLDALNDEERTTEVEMEDGKQVATNDAADNPADDNRPTLPDRSVGWTKGRVPIMTGEGLKHADGWVKGGFGVSRLPDGKGSPRLTHLETGMRVWSGKTTICKRLADALADYLDVLTQGPDVMSEEDKEAIKGLVWEARRLEMGWVRTPVNPTGSK